MPPPLKSHLDGIQRMFAHQQLENNTLREQLVLAQTENKELRVQVQTLTITAEKGALSTQSTQPANPPSEQIPSALASSTQSVVAGAQTIQSAEWAVAWRDVVLHHLHDFKKKPDLDQHMTARTAKFAAKHLLKCELPSLYSTVKSNATAIPHSLIPQFIKFLSLPPIPSKPPTTPTAASSNSAAVKASQQKSVLPSQSKTPSNAPIMTFEPQVKLSDGSLNVERYFAWTDIIEVARPLYPAFDTSASFHQSRLTNFRRRNNLPNVRVPCHFKTGHTVSAIPERMIADFLDDMRRPSRASDVSFPRVGSLESVATDENAAEDAAANDTHETIAVAISRLADQWFRCLIVASVSEMSAIKAQVNGSGERAGYLEPHRNSAASTSPISDDLGDIALKQPVEPYQGDKGILYNVLLRKMTDYDEMATVQRKAVKMGVKDFLSECMQERGSTLKECEVHLSPGIPGKEDQLTYLIPTDCVSEFCNWIYDELLRVFPGRRLQEIPEMAWSIEHRDAMEERRRKKEIGDSSEQDAPARGPDCSNSIHSINHHLDPILANSTLNCIYNHNVVAGISDTDTHLIINCRTFNSNGKNNSLRATVSTLREAITRVERLEREHAELVAIVAESNPVIPYTAGQASSGAIHSKHPSSNVINSSSNSIISNYSDNSIASFHAVNSIKQHIHSAHSSSLSLMDIDNEVDADSDNAMTSNPPGSGRGDNPVKKHACDVPGCPRVYASKGAVNTHKQENHLFPQIMFANGRSLTVHRDQDGFLMCPCANYKTPSTTTMKNHAKLCLADPSSENLTSSPAASNSTNAMHVNVGEAMPVVETAELLSQKADTNGAVSDITASTGLNLVKTDHGSLQSEIDAMEPIPTFHDGTENKDRYFAWYDIMHKFASHVDITSGVHNKVSQFRFTHSLSPKPIARKFTSGKATHGIPQHLIADFLKVVNKNLRHILAATTGASDSPGGMATPNSPPRPAFTLPDQQLEIVPETHFVDGTLNTERYIAWTDVLASYSPGIAVTHALKKRFSQFRANHPDLSSKTIKKKHSEGYSTTGIPERLFTVFAMEMFRPLRARVETTPAKRLKTADDALDMEDILEGVSAGKVGTLNLQNTDVLGSEGLVKDESASVGENMQSGVSLHKTASDVPCEDDTDVESGDNDELEGDEMAPFDGIEIDSLGDVGVTGFTGTSAGILYNVLLRRMVEDYDRLDSLIRGDIKSEVCAVLTSVLQAVGQSIAEFSPTLGNSSKVTYLVPYSLVNVFSESIYPKLVVALPGRTVKKLDGSLSFFPLRAE
ncbi:hypothetical protein HDU80_009104 [Chytriomyces hyalinus]|nr:hypothetical protein HDU80_009104 [Chytriomyces hyalinus]